MKTSHEFDVEGFEGVAGRLNKVDTRMNAIIDDISTMRFILCLEVRIESRLDTFQNGFPTIISFHTKRAKKARKRDLPVFIVDEIAESRGIDDVKSQSNAIFFDISGDSTDIDGLRDFNGSRTIAVSRRIQTRVKQSIHQS